MKVLVIASEAISADRLLPAQRIVLFTRPESEHRYDEGIDADALQQRFGLPVQHAA